MQDFGAGSTVDNHVLDGPASKVDRPDSQRVARGRSRRTEIVAEAARLFAEQGYYSVGMRDIAHAVGIRGASLYNHFSSKEDVLYAITLQMTKAPLDDQLRLLDAPGTPASRLHAFVRAHIRLLAENRVEHLVALTELKALTGEHQAEVAEYRKYYQRRVNDVITAGVHSGDFVVTDPGATTIALLDMLNGISWWLRDDHDFEALTTNYEKLIISGLLQAGNGD